MQPKRSYHKDLIYDLQDPEEAAGYLNAALADDDQKVFLLALRHVLEARGSITEFARLSKINRVSLYKMLSEKGNPEFQSLISLLNALGVQLQIIPQKSTPKRAA